MSWLQIRFTTESDQQEPLEDALLSAGAISITYQDAADQPILEPGLAETPLWDNLVLTALFHAESDIKAVLRFAESAYQKALPDHKVEILEDKDWVREWMSQYHPVQCGHRLWICPSWRDPVDPKAVNLRLDPGLAFGTGTHPTTALCLACLDSMVLTGLDVLDYGCGSGILAIASLLLGARHATGVDIDPQAILASRDNAARNNIQDEHLELFLPNDCPDIQTDIVIANILAGPLVDLAEKLTRHVKPGGQIILSGIIASQKQAILDAYKDIDWQSIDQKDEWMCFKGLRQN